MNIEQEINGFTTVPGLLTPSEQKELIGNLGPVIGAGRRGLMSIPSVVSLIQSPRIINIVRPYLGFKPTPIRTIYFDKSPESNWLVSWHQDLTIAVKEKKEIQGFGPWSEKDGIPHVQPPEELLRQILTIRIHLDDTNETNGALRVIPGSHKFGRLSPEEIQRVRTENPEHLCSALAGDAMLMRPLLLHASGKSTSQNHRRILHVEYAGFELPSGLCWHESA